MNELAKSLRLVAHRDQTPASYCSQIAHKVGRGANEFCLDMGLRFKDLVDGDPAAISKLERLCGLPGGFFEGSTIRALSAREFSVVGLNIPRETLCRSEVRVCPHCISEDADGVEGSKGVYHRIDWLFDAIRRCEEHGCMLVPLYPNDKPAQPHDTSAHLQEALEKIGDLKLASAPCEPSDLAYYIAAAIRGQSPQPAPFGLPLHAVAKLSEVLGAVMLHGPKTALNSLSHSDWHRAGHTGFGALRDGEMSFWSALRMLQDKAICDRQILGAKSTYGRLYDFLSADNDDPAYQPVRDSMRSYLLANIAYGPGDLLFGSVVDRRILHSVRSASLETGLHPKRLKKMLVAAHIAPQEQRDWMDDQIIFEAQNAAPMLERFVGAMSLGEAAQYLGIPRPHDAVLARSGVLPAVLPFDSPELKDGCFSKEDLDGFFERLTRLASPLQPDDTSFVPILEAAKRANCGVLEVIKLLLADGIQHVRLDSSQSGFPSIRIRPDELKPLVRLPDHGGIPVYKAMKQLKTSERVMDALLALGHLPFRIEVNPIKRAKQRYIDQKELDDFMLTFVSLASFSAEVGVHFKKVQKAAEAAGVRPAFDRELVHSTFYRRVDLAEIEVE